MDFSLQQVWGLTLVLFFLWLEKRSDKSIISLLTGIALSMTVLGYVGMIVLYPVVAGIYLFEGRSRTGEGDKAGTKESFLRIAYMTLSCACMAALFFLYCIPLQGISVSEFAGNIPNIFMDGTHSLGFGDRLLLYASQWAVVIKHSAVFIAAALICMFAGKFVIGRTSGFVISLAQWVMTVSSLLLIAGPAVGIKMGPFHFQSRFLLIYILMWIIAVKERSFVKNEAGYMLWVVMILSAASFAGVLLFSNVGPDSSSSYLTPGLVAGLIFMYVRVMDGEKTEASEKKLLNDRNVFCIAAALFVISLIMCKGFYVRFTEYFPADITQKREKVSGGPLDGIYLLSEDAKTESEGRKLIEDNTEGRSAMLLGTDQILDLSMKGRVICPSTISTPAFNRQWVLYFEKYPHLLPDVVFIAKNTIDDREKFFAGNEFGQYIAEYYDIMDMRENDALCMITRKQSRE